MHNFEDLVSLRCVEHQPSWQARLNAAIAKSNNEAAARRLLNSNIAVNGYGEAHVAEMERRIADIAAIASKVLASVPGEVDPEVAEQAIRDISKRCTPITKDLWTARAAGRGLSNLGAFGGFWEQSQVRLRAAIDAAAATLGVEATKKNAQIRRDSESSLQTDSQMRTASHGSTLNFWTIIGVLIAGFALLVAWLKE